MKKVYTQINLCSINDNPFFGETVTEIAISDEAAGTFLKVTQYQDDGHKELRFDVDEIDVICESLQEMKNTALTLNEGYDDTDETIKFDDNLDD